MTVAATPIPNATARDKTVDVDSPSSRTPFSSPSGSQAVSANMPANATVEIASGVRRADRRHHAALAIAYATAIATVVQRTGDALQNVSIAASTISASNIRNGITAGTSTWFGTGGVASITLPE